MNKSNISKFAFTVVALPLGFISSKSVPVSSFLFISYALACFFYWFTELKLKSNTQNSRVSIFTLLLFGLLFLASYYYNFLSSVPFYKAMVISIIVYFCGESLESLFHYYLKRPTPKYL
ncbi:hypothetical protein IMX26_13525 [Clostridium sp. 'deep sea']|uniref:hypothetical protein n=1 Tax=Clostridium sp. 'deep sea' TaxID=2779445 RepID=UPI0018966D66|nr:hypothetical protein [Clostridium sp. 'deep sea']QOR34492.1 hypothetical protein IMX26_13525 [Clostridium sp. 'deep sea']